MDGVSFSLPPEGTPSHLGGFRILRRLASGGTSDVLLARAEGPHGFERVVALKVLLPHLRNDASFERMFAREASAYARLNHPAIVKLYDFFSADGQLVMVLEYVDGLPLNKLRAMLSIAGHQLDDRASIFLASRIFAALAAAHNAKDPATGEFSPVIHRDINPSNVLIPWDGHVKLGDFGIAKVTGMQGDTKSGFIKGTYGYMAPEQVRGETVTVRADVYTASLLLWELLAHRKAIQRGALPEVEVLKAMATPKFPPLDKLRPDADASVRDAVRRGLEPNPDRRAITADEMASLLRASINVDEARALLVATLGRVRPASPTTELAVTQSQPTAGEAPADTLVDARPLMLAAALAAQTDREQGKPSEPKSPPKTPPRLAASLPAQPPRPASVTKVAAVAPAPPLLTPPIPPSSPLVRASADSPNVAPPEPTPPPPAEQTSSPLVTPPPVSLPPEPTSPPPPATSRPKLPEAAMAAFSFPPPSSPQLDVTIERELSEPAPSKAAPGPPPSQPGPPPPIVSLARSKGHLVWPALAGTFVSVCAVVLYASLSSRPSPANVRAVDAAPAVATIAAAPPPSFTAPAALAPASAAPPAPSGSQGNDVTTGEITGPAYAAGHRIFVDGHVVGEGPGPWVVRCGQRTVRVGSAGTPMKVDVPCGGSIHVP